MKIYSRKSRSSDVSKFGIYLRKWKTLGNGVAKVTREQQGCKIRMDYPNMEWGNAEDI